MVHFGHGCRLSHGVANCFLGDDYKVITESVTVVPRSLAFPQVTVCSTNPKTMPPAWPNWALSIPKNQDELRQISMQNLVHETWFNYEPLEASHNYWTETITDEGLCHSFITDKRVIRPGTFGGLELLGQFAARPF